MRKEKRDPRDPALQKRQKSGKWGHDKGFAWVSREELDRRCMRHPRRIVRRMFFGRRVTVLVDAVCRLRAMIRKSRKGALVHASALKADVEISQARMVLKP